MPNRRFNKQVAQPHSGKAWGNAQKGGSGSSGREKPGFSFSGKAPAKTGPDRSAGTKRCKFYPDREGL